MLVLVCALVTAVLLAHYSIYLYCVANHMVCIYNNNSAWSEITKDVADLTTNWTDSLKNLTWRWEVVIILHYI